jgi:ribose 5-phosphate isomerase A
MIMTLKEKVAVVTGGNSGIGQAIGLEPRAGAPRSSSITWFISRPPCDSALGAQSIGVKVKKFVPSARQIDLTIDGADEVERGTLNLIKELGGALLREKIVAAASHRLAIVVDGSKLVDRLGAHTPVPVEVVAFWTGGTPGVA